MQLHEHSRTLNAIFYYSLLAVDIKDDFLPIPHGCTRLSCELQVLFWYLSLLSNLTPRQSRLHTKRQNKLYSRIRELFCQVPLACLGIIAQGSMARGSRAGKSVELWGNSFKTTLYSSFFSLSTFSISNSTKQARV